MAIQTYNTGNTVNWELLWSTSQTAPTPPGGVKELYRYYPIHPFSLPLLIDAQYNLIAVYCTSTTAESYWHYAGRAVQKISTGVLTAGTQDATVSVKKIWLNQVSLLNFFTGYQPTYGLFFEIPYWIRQISISVHKYIGPVSDSYLNKMSSIHGDLITLQNDFDAFTGL